MFPICLHSVSLTGNSNDHDENFERSTYYCSTNRLAVTTRDIRVLKRNVSVTRGVFLVLLQEMQPGKILTHTPLQHTYKLPTILNGIEISDVLTK